MELGTAEDATYPSLHIAKLTERQIFRPTLTESLPDTVKRLVTNFIKSTGDANRP